MNNYALQNIVYSRERVKAGNAEELRKAQILQVVSTNCADEMNESPSMEASEKCSGVIYEVNISIVSRRYNLVSPLRGFCVS